MAMAQGNGLVVRGARVATLAGGPRRGEAMGRIGIVENGAVAMVGDRIAYVGPDADLPDALRRLPTWAAGGRVALPGLVDAHTHLPFAAWRADEYAARLEGASYAAQQNQDRRRPRGIARSAAQLGAAGDAQVEAFCRRRLGEALRSGTTTLEMKSGYGLDAQGERRAVRLMAALAAATPQRVVRTGLFLHAVPPCGGREAWLGAVMDDLLPWAAESGAVDGVDAFVEQVAYSLDEVAPLLREAKRRGLLTHLHAGQLGPSGACAWAAGEGLTSVDHLDYLDGAGVRAFASSPTAAVLLPGATFLAGATHRPPARDLIAAGALVAVATDLNPGTAPVSSMPEAMAMACRLFGLGVAEAVAAATINAAATLGLADEVGSLEVGKRADLVLLEGDDPALVAYRLGTPAIDLVVAAGRIAYDAGGDGENAS